MKNNKLKALLANLFGVKEWKVNAEGHLDVSAEELTALTEKYGEEFITKFEKLLSEEEINTNSNINQNQSDMPKELKLAFLCALLSVNAFSVSEEGNITLTQEQCESIEGELKRLQEENTAAASNLTAATTERDNAVNALAGVTTAMDELDATVVAAADPKAKVEAIRAKLAQKPVFAATAVTTKGDPIHAKIEGADEVSEYVKEII